MKLRLLLLSFLSLCLSLSAQSDISVADLISASQADVAKVRFFACDPKSASDVQVDGFADSREFAVRRGVPNFMRKCRAGGEVTVAFIGGSITRSDNQYRNQVAGYIASMFPNVKMNGVNAGIGGTGADLGACRLERDVLKFKPDLLFVEFAVNGAYDPGVEGIIRKMVKDNPYTDICLVYTIYRGQSSDYAKGEIPFNVKRLEKVAEYYNLPSVHMGMWAGMLERDNKLLWAAPASHKGSEIIFSRDGVHPIKAGGDLYASAVARAFNSMKSSGRKVAMELPEPLLPKQMEQAQSIDPGRFLKGVKGWSRVDVESDKEFSKYALWFDSIYKGDKSSEPIRFSFEGDMLAIYDMGAPDVGAYDIFLNGRKLVTSRFDHNGKMVGYDFVDKDDPRPSMMRFNKYCYQLRQQYEVIKLDRARYDVEIKASSTPIDKVALLSAGKAAKANQTVVSVGSDGKLSSEYNPQRVYLGWIMINGEVIE